MGKIAAICPGQGSQEPGMGRMLCQVYPCAQEVFSQAEEITNIPLSKYCFRGPEKKLQDTKISQPAILTVSVAFWKVLSEKGIVFSAVAGHSLGEFSACVLSEALSFADALKLVTRRSSLMLKACEEQKGAMLAVIGLGEEEIHHIINNVDGGISIANFNSPFQFVLSGDVVSIGNAQTLATSIGAERTIPLKVSGAFHSPLMKSASDAFELEIDNVEFKRSRIPIVTNVGGTVVQEPDEIRSALKKQMLSSVRWTSVIQVLLELGCNSFIEVGPGKVLRGLMRNIDKNLPVISAEQKIEGNEVPINS